MGAMAEKITLPASDVLLEMMAAWRAVAFVHELGLNNAIFEGDLEIVIKALNHMSAKRTRIASSSSLSDGDNNSFMFNRVLPPAPTTEFWCNPGMVPVNAVYAMPVPVTPMMFWPCLALASGGAPVKMESSQTQLGSFLERCHLCKKWIGDNDVYMYGNLQAFCSSECRDEQILIDKLGETRSNCKVARRLL